MKIITPDNIDQFSSQEPPKNSDGKYKKKFEVKEKKEAFYVAASRMVPYKKTLSL